MYHSCVFFIKTAERIFYDIFGVSSLKSSSEESEKHGEVDRSWRLVHHPLEVVVRGVLAERGEHVVQVLLVDEPVPVVVDHVERLLELLDLVLAEHGEHIGRGP